MMWLCASFMLLAAAARQVSRAVPISTSGSRISSSLPIAAKLTSSDTVAPVARLALALNESRISSIETMPSSAAAAILPLTSAPREAGVASSGSSDCRSRSPAVVSMARCEPPMKAKMVRIIGSRMVMNMPLLASGVARSRVPVFNGAATIGLIPRASRRSEPTVCPYWFSASRTRAAGTSALRRVVSVTISSLAGLPARQSAGKSGAITSATSSCCARMRASMSAGAALALMPLPAR